jgi:DNA-binding LacI/PurR family transcriptional regulator
MELPRRTSLVPQIVEIVRRDLRAGKWTQRLPSESELAEKLQVSRPTLRAALGRLAEEGLIRARHGLGWEIVSRPKRSAPPRSPKTIGLLSFVSLDQAPPFALFLIDKLEHHLGDAGWKVEVRADSKYLMQNHRRALAELMKTSRADLWVMFGANTGIDEWFQERRIPVFSVGKPREGIRCPWLDWDQRAVFRHAAGLLLARGHRHFVCLLPRYMAFGYKEASEGFREGVERYGRNQKSPLTSVLSLGGERKYRQDHAQENLLSPWGRGQGEGCRSKSAQAESSTVSARIVYHPGTVDGVCRVVASVFGVAKPPTALLVSSPRHALTAMTHLAHIGRKIPGDVSVIAVGHEPFLDNVSPSIAHYSMNRVAFARKLCRMVLQCATAGGRSMPGATVMGRFQDGVSLAVLAR